MLFNHYGAFWTLWGLLEWLAQENGETPDYYCSNSSELTGIKDLAFSAKHRALNGKKRTVKHAGLRNSGCLAYNVAGGYGVPSGGLGSINPVIVLTGGDEHDLLTIVEKAEKFLTEKL